jgi:hypothetical protein
MSLQERINDIYKDKICWEDQMICYFPDKEKHTSKTAKVKK